MGRDYYNRRVGGVDERPRLSLAETADLVADAYVLFAGQGCLQRSFGYDCVDAGAVPGLHGTDLRRALYLQTSIKITEEVATYLRTAEEVAFFTVIEFVHDHVARPAQDAGWHHSYSGCGMHYN